MAIANGSRFDFEVGSLDRSPCRHCQNRFRLPECMHDCKLIGMVQQQLTQVISCNHAVSELDTYTLSLPDRNR
jgi:hypothetical protein